MQDSKGVFAVAFLRFYVVECCFLYGSKWDS
jgi:hypothetical protein